MASQDDALYAQGQQLARNGDVAGARAIMQQLQARGYRPPTAAAPTPQPAPAAPAAPAPQSAPAPANSAPAPAQQSTPGPSAPAVNPNDVPPPEIAAGGPQAIAAFREARRLHLAGQQEQARLAGARAAGYARAQQLRQTLSGGSSAATILSFVPAGVSNFIGRFISKPAGMSDAEFNEYSRALHESLQQSHPLSSFAGVALQSALIPELGAEGAVARLGGGTLARVGARIAENAGVGGAQAGVNSDSADQIVPGAVASAAVGEAARVAGHGLSVVTRRLFPGRSPQAYRVIQRELDDAQITPQELQAAEQRFRQNTGRTPSPLEILNDPALGDRGQRARNAILAITRGNRQAAATMQNFESEAVREARARNGTYGNPHPETSRQSNAAFGAIRDTVIPAEDAASLMSHEDIGSSVIRPSQGDSGMLHSQVSRFHGATDVVHFRAAEADAQQEAARLYRALTGLQQSGNASPTALRDAYRATQQAVLRLRAARQATARAEANYAENPVTINEIDALRQRIRNRVQGTGGTHAAGALGDMVTNIGDRATGGQYSANIAAHAANAQAEEDALSRGLEAVRGATPGAAYEGGGGAASHVAAGAAHAINGSSTGAMYHASQAARAAGRGVNPREARNLAAEVTTPGATNQFAENLARGSRQQRAQQPTIASETGRVAARIVGGSFDKQAPNLNSPTNDQLYAKGQALLRSGDRAGATAIMQELKRSGYQPAAPETATPTSFAVPASTVDRMIQAREGFRAHTYNDAGGNPTIGYGHKIEPGEDFSNGITEPQARALMRRDIARTSAPLHNLNRNISAGQREALVSFGYNAGPGALQRVVDSINKTGNFVEASRIIGHYTTSSGRHVPALAARRRMEVAALNEGAG